MSARTCYMIVTPRGNPATIDFRAPVYWRKKWAITAMENRQLTNCRVVRIELPKTAPWLPVRPEGE